MKSRFTLELAVGTFLILGVACLAYLSVRLGKMEVLGRRGYELTAVFSNVGGLREGAAVVIAGVNVGRVRSIRLDNYQALVTLQVDPGLHLQEDAIASVKTRGLIGEKYVDISAGASDQDIPPGGRIRQTEPAIDMEAIIGKYAFGRM